MFRSFFIIGIACLFSVGAVAQISLSNSGLMEIKEQSEGKRMQWARIFDECVQKKSFASLPPVRQDAELFIDEVLVHLKRAQASGDERPLLVAVKNYLQIERQFVKDIMIPAESIAAGDAEAAEGVYKKILEFAQKEKIFIMDINNAIMSSPDPQSNLQQPEGDEDEDAAAPPPGGKEDTKGKKQTEAKEEDEEE